MKLLTAIVAVLSAAGTAVAFAPAVPSFQTRTRSAVQPLNMAVAEEEFYIDEERRFIMNLILLGSATVTVGALAVPYIAFFVPPGAGGGSGGTTAKDALGNDIFAKEYLEAKNAGDRSLAQGLKGDATYLIVKEDKTFESYGLNAVCTHLGCVVPWSAAANKFQCPCHGSQYAPDGHVVRGPAPLPLALAHCNTDDEGKVVFTTWTEDDFRTGGKGWWN
uniref:plastoquinol--plastocyanin reductase n=1 Tax=Grammatophora oceanica TaxID=210454 RepID=A0A7S1VPK7_9STRA|mmetsp:Transcript_50827/g.75987  ORF Transcript_50827/g.75987 Transcript_50827/m.75987 type:complete len:219 (+) Transcript_50827:121-777(+)|eukprot:CAMPEP_0194028878 /NCGR_PEP_ID=MMETSP0009_2-20130614/2753_1 /TAXON_ID=210454 /ORGANISM="Grammatophora oceanica, Strain CCMP 410" /LENGTH=218 /DNA_ID=CAMNT_0038668397 /DNA_START=99 /DNA_END=755 /DNA_ORIENTATION=+